jgi:branched-chain amino acid transport system substrate-binding protein
MHYIKVIFLSQKWIKFMALGLLVLALGWLLYTQARANSAPPTVKIGLVAPFEGLYRSSGYEVLFAVKVALQERNQAQGINGYRVELVALNDFNDPVEAAKQAKALVADPDVLGVVGHLTSASTLAAMPVYQEAHLAMCIPWSITSSAFENGRPGMVTVAATYEETAARLEMVTQEMGVEHLTTVTGADIKAIPGDVQGVRLAMDAVTAGNTMLQLRELNNSLPLFGHVETGNLQLVQVAGPAANGFIFVSPAPSADDLPGQATFVETYQAMAGLPPTPRAVLAYDATNVLLDSIEQAMIMKNHWPTTQPDRADVSAALSAIQRQGVSGQIAFDPTGRRLDAPVWVYQISEAIYPGTLFGP